MAQIDLSFLHQPHKTFLGKRDIDDGDHASTKVAAFDAASIPLPTSLRNVPLDYKPERFQDIRCPDLKFRHGTTTLGFVLKDRVVVAVDSRATMGTYIASNTVKKIHIINSHLVGTIAGGAADCQYWERVLSTECELYRLRNQSKITVAASSKILSNILWNYRGYGLSMGVIMAGFDIKGPNIFYVDSDATRLNNKVFSVGSGSTHALAIVDKYYREDMEEKEATSLARRAIYHATHRDAASGGIIRVGVIDKDGFRYVYEGDMNELHDLYAGERAKVEAEAKARYGEDDGKVRAGAPMEIS